MKTKNCKACGCCMLNKYKTCPACGFYPYKNGGTIETRKSLTDSIKWRERHQNVYGQILKK